MKYISSDTNIWLDFEQIGRLNLPFALDYTYVMSSDTINDELLDPPELKERLLSFGLLPLDIDESEYKLAIQYGQVYRKLSVYDRFALAIAKRRGYILLSGDGALRQAAIHENITVKGTIWIIDQLLDQGKIPNTEYHAIMTELHDDTSGKVRLPRNELLKRITDPNTSP